MRGYNKMIEKVQDSHFILHSQLVCNRELTALTKD